MRQVKTTSFAVQLSVALTSIIVASLASPGMSGADYGDAPPSNPCYVGFTVSCGDVHANGSRVCTSGANSVLCGDIIVFDQSVSDVMLAANGQAGQTGISMPCGTVTVWVHKFSCGTGGDSGVCHNHGVKQLTCQGRCPTGPNCTGGAIVPP